VHLRTWEVDEDEAPPRPRLVQDISLDTWEERQP
jgi:hypothetical protein